MDQLTNLAEDQETSSGERMVAPLLDIEPILLSYTFMLQCTDITSQISITQFI